MTMFWYCPRCTCREEASHRWCSFCGVKLVAELPTANNTRNEEAMATNRDLGATDDSDRRAAAFEAKCDALTVERDYWESEAKAHNATATQYEADIKALRKDVERRIVKARIDEADRALLLSSKRLDEEEFDLELKGRISELRASLAKEGE